MRKVIVLANQKGGVGKTTTASAMISGLSNSGYKVLGIDLDPQGNLSDNCDAEMYNKPTIYELLRNDVSLDDAIQNMKGFDIIPSNIMLAGAEQEFSQTGKEYKLKEIVSPIKENYNFIIIDTPPSLGILTVNAFTFADEVIIPTTAGIFAANGICQLNNTVQTVRKYCNPGLKIAGILITRYNQRTVVSKQIKELTEVLGRKINTSIYKTYIRNGIVVEEAQANHKDIFTYSNKSNVAADYKAFINEYLSREAEI